MGFSDEMVGQLADRLPEQVRELRLEMGLLPVYKMVDTCAAEFEAVTPYYYSTYEQENEAIARPEQAAIVIGSGPIRIGQGIEFDYASVHAAWALQASGYRAIMVNSNPETVSTDFDISDRLYFEPLDDEAVRDLIANERGEAADSPATIVQFGGQTAINLADPLRRAALPIIGSGADTIDTAEDRKLFERFLQGAGIPQPPGAAVLTLEDAMKTAQAVGYPVVVRPSFVLGGRAMEVVQNATEMVTFVSEAAKVAEGRPILVDKYLEGAEVEVDAICDGTDVLIPGIMEHIERAGVHSGDSMAVYPPRNLDADEIATICDYTERIVLGLKAHRAHQYPVCGPAEGRRRASRVRPRSEPARQPHGAVPLEGHRRADGPDRGPDDARPIDSRTGLPAGPLAGHAARRDQGAGVLDVEAPRRRHATLARR